MVPSTDHCETPVSTYIMPVKKKITSLSLVHDKDSYDLDQ